MESLLQKITSEILLEYENNNNLIQGVVLEKNKIIQGLQETIQNNESSLEELTNKVSELTQECKNYESVSIHKNLSKQISEKDNEIRILQNRLSTMEKKYNSLNKKYEAIILQESNTNIEGSEIESIEADNEVSTSVEEVVGEDEEEVEDVEEEVKEVEEEVEEVEEEVKEVKEEEVEEVEDDEDCEVIELEFYEKRLKPKNGKGRILFLITDDEQRDIYERLEDGEPGEHIGRLVGKSNRPHFF